MVVVKEEVRSALSAGRPVVALESTIITHGALALHCPAQLPGSSSRRCLPSLLSQGAQRSHTSICRHALPAKPGDSQASGSSGELHQLHAAWCAWPPPVSKWTP